MVRSTHPLVSVVVVSYNAESFILECLESISRQTYSRIELVVCDDGSQDETPSRINEWIQTTWGRFESIKYIAHSSNQGITRNLNSGLQIATGDWIKIIAADDALYENCIDLYVNAIINNPSAKAFYSDVSKYQDTFSEENRIVTPTLRDILMSQSGTSAEVQFGLLLYSNQIWAASLFLKKTLLEKIGYCDESVRHFEDRPLLLKITKSGERLFYCNFISAKYRVHSKSIQRIKTNDDLFSVLQTEQARYLLQNYTAYLKDAAGYVLRSKCRFIVFMSDNCNKRNFLTRSLRFFFMTLIAFFEKHTAPNIRAD